MLAHPPKSWVEYDVIVRYPETDEDFEATMALMRAVEFDSAFMFIYSEEMAPTLRDGVQTMFRWRLRSAHQV